MKIKHIGLYRLRLLARKQALSGVSFRSGGVASTQRHQILLHAATELAPFRAIPSGMCGPKSEPCQQFSAGLWIIAFRPPEMGRSINFATTSALTLIFLTFCWCVSPFVFLGSVSFPWTKVSSLPVWQDKESDCLRGREKESKNQENTYPLKEWFSLQMDCTSKKCGHVNGDNG